MVFDKTQFLLYGLRLRELPQILNVALFNKVRYVTMTTADNRGTGKLFPPQTDKVELTFLTFFSNLAMSLIHQHKEASVNLDLKYIIVI